MALRGQQRLNIPASVPVSGHVLLENKMYVSWLVCVARLWMIVSVREDCSKSVRFTDLSVDLFFPLHISRTSLTAA